MPARGGGARAGRVKSGHHHAHKTNDVITYHKDFKSTVKAPELTNPLKSPFFWLWAAHPSHHNKVVEKQDQQKMDGINESSEFNPTGGFLFFLVLIIGVLFLINKMLD